MALGTAEGTIVELSSTAVRVPNSNRSLRRHSFWKREVGLHMAAERIKKDECFEVSLHRATIRDEP